MAINILSLWCRLVMVAKRLKILAHRFMGDIMFDSIFLLDIHSVEEVHQALGSQFVSKGQKVNADFIHDVFIDQEGLVPISIGVNWKDLMVSEECMIQLTEPLSAVFPSTHPDCHLVRGGAPPIVCN